MPQKLIVNNPTPLEMQRRLHKSLNSLLKARGKVPPDEIPSSNPPPFDWHLQQTVFPKRVRRSDWKQRLVAVVDQWSDYKFSTGELGCFTFTCSAVDAMIGSSLADLYRHNLRGNHRNHFKYIRKIGAHDYFDIAGIRTRLEDVQCGDILQYEEPVIGTGRAHVHWSIKGEDPGQYITFTMSGLLQEKLPPGLISKARVWRPGLAVRASQNRQG